MTAKPLGFGTRPHLAAAALAKPSPPQDDVSGEQLAAIVRRQPETIRQTPAVQKSPAAGKVPVSMRLPIETLRRLKALSDRQRLTYDEAVTALLDYAEVDSSGKTPKPLVPIE